MEVRYIIALLGLIVLMGLGWIGGNSNAPHEVPDLAYYVVGLFIIGVLSGPEGIISLLQIFKEDKNEDSGKSSS